MEHEHAAHAGATPAPHPHYRQYLVIFGVLTVLTAAEIGVVYMGLPKAVMIAALIILALVKAGLVGLYFMHMLQETTVLKLTVAIPLMIPFVYAVILISESGWRFLRLAGAATGVHP